MNVYPTFVQNFHYGTPNQAFSMAAKASNHCKSAMNAAVERARRSTLTPPAAH